MYKIYTLGDFDIQYNNKSILDERGYPNTTIKLFKYFLTYEGKRMIPDKIIEDLWEYDYLEHPHNALRTQISRVRKIMDSNELNIESFFKVEFKNGYYLFELEDENMLDYKRFESLIQESNYLLKEDIDSGISILKKAISLYKGEYLQELQDEDWIVPIRNRYDRLYFKSLETYLNILKNKEEYNEIINLCESALEYEPYEETLHLYYLESLMKVGKDRNALNHYNFYTSMFYKDLGLVPSEKSKELYKKLQLKDEKVDRIIDLNIVGDLLKEDNNEGPVVCDFNYFKFLYNFELRSIERNKDRDIFLGIVTIDNLGCMPLEKDDLRNSMEKLLDTTQRDLRKGDVISKWNDNQLLLLMYYIKEKDLEKINRRLREGFKEQGLKDDIILNIKYKKLY